MAGIGTCPRAMLNLAGLGAWPIRELFDFIFNMGAFNRPIRKGVLVVGTRPLGVSIFLFVGEKPVI